MRAADMTTVTPRAGAEAVRADRRSGSAGARARVADPARPTEGEDTERWWRRELEARTGQHAPVRDLDLRDVGELGGHRSGLCRSLAIFQLGESGSGDHLLHAAARAGASADHRRALELFVGEEQEHARMLAAVLDALAFPVRTHHWTDRIFVALRRARSLRTEVLTLMVAEVVGLCYYEALRDGLTDPTLHDVCRRIHADEVSHIDFHVDTLPCFTRRWTAIGLGIARAGWNVGVAGASVVVAAGHGAALSAAGTTRWAFVRRVGTERRAVDRRLFGPARAAATVPSAPRVGAG
jgi:hypothetical protein